jgi:hypothetical protein
MSPLRGFALGEVTWVDMNSEIYAHDDVSLAPGLDLPAGSSMILTILEAWPSYMKDNDEYTVGHKKNDIHAGQEGWSMTTWQCAGLVIVQTGESLHGRDYWRRIGAFLFTARRKGDLTISTPFDLDRGEDEELILV